MNGQKNAANCIIEKPALISCGSPGPEVAAPLHVVLLAAIDRPRTEVIGVFFGLRPPIFPQN